MRFAEIKKKGFELLKKKLKENLLSPNIIRLELHINDESALLNDSTVYAINK